MRIISYKKSFQSPLPKSLWLLTLTALFLLQNAKSAQKETLLLDSWDTFPHPPHTLIPVLVDFILSFFPVPSIWPPFPAPLLEFKLPHLPWKYSTNLFKGTCRSYIPFFYLIHSFFTEPESFSRTQIQSHYSSVYKAFYVLPCDFKTSHVVNVTCKTWVDLPLSTWPYSSWPIWSLNMSQVDLAEAMLPFPTAPWHGPMLPLLCAMDIRPHPDLVTLLTVSFCVSPRYTDS